MKNVIRDQTFLRRYWTAGSAGRLITERVMVKLGEEIPQGCEPDCSDIGIAHFTIAAHNAEAEADANPPAPAPAAPAKKDAPA